MRRFEKLQILVTRADPEVKDRTVNEFVECWLNMDHVTTARVHEDDKFIVEMNTGKSLVVKGLDFDKL